MKVTHEIESLFQEIISLKTVTVHKNSSDLMDFPMRGNQEAE